MVDIVQVLTKLQSNGVLESLTKLFYDTFMVE